MQHDPATATGGPSTGSGTATDVVLVTGPSGAGRTTAIRALEDAGYEVIDNMPLSLVDRLLDGPPDRPLALGVDVRNRDFGADAACDLAARLEADPRWASRVLYLDCAAPRLVARFSETRRRHPLAPAGDVESGIAQERGMLAPLRERADLVIDTTALTVHELKAAVQRAFAPDGRAMALSVQSFSFKRGLPRGLDTVFDVRFLSNPHWVPELRASTGRDPAVARHVEADGRFAGFYDRLLGLLLEVLPGYRDEGRAHLTIGIGCTGGRHRSVVVAEKLSGALAERGWRVSIRHRELDRGAAAGADAPAGGVA